MSDGKTPEMARHVTETQARDGPIPRAQRLVWLAILLCHLIGAALWWWLAPGGFPWGHPRFWSRVLPFGVAVWIVGALVSLHREAPRRLLVFLTALPAMWLAGAVTARWIFPTTFAVLWLGPLLAGMVMAVLVITLGRRVTPRPMRAVLSAALPAIGLGAALVLCQRPPAPATHPLDEAPGWIDEPGQACTSAPALAPAVPPVLSGRVISGQESMVYTSEGALTVRIAPLTLSISPLLRFLSQSADGCWTVFVRPDDRSGPEPRLRGGSFRDSGTWDLTYDLKGQGPAFLRLTQGPEPAAIRVDAVSRLDRPIYSHLNTYCDMEVRGHHRLSLEFSPCLGTRIEVTRFDYPFGRPARFAYVDVARRFRVVEAANGEKGPFQVLAEGMLRRSDALGITFWDEAQPVAQVTLHDWSAQASTELSPTAGWGVPQNAIEFSLNDDAPTSPASLFVTLAGTSVGRGWDCVGHAAGLYRNRITIQPAARPSAEVPP